MDDAPFLAVITGPTGTGKTELGVILALELGGEVISADSMQIYRGMDIGTAKPAKADMRGVPHHMLDCADPWERYSVARYVEEATAAALGIISRGRLPIVVGGTGLYIDSLVRGLAFSGAPDDRRLRDALGAEYDAVGGEKMLERLRRIDPERAELLAPGDRRRIVRALEVYELTGITISRHDRETREIPPRFRSRAIALDYKNRADLYALLDGRVDRMFELGLENEVRTLLRNGLDREATAMQAIGYKETALALEGVISLDEAVTRIKQGTRNYAKRQLTWLRRKNDLRWIRWDSHPDFDSVRRDSTDYFCSPDIE